MQLSPNIYHAVVFDIHPKIREFLDKLDTENQIDHDENGSPHLISVDTLAPSVYKCVIVRNGKPVSFSMHTRKKMEPVTSWNLTDGYKRKDIGVDTRKERDKRTFEDIVEQIIPLERL